MKLYKTYLFISNLFYYLTGLYFIINVLFYLISGSKPNIYDAIIALIGISIKLFFQYLSTEGLKNL